MDPIDPEILYGEYNYCFSEWKPQPHMADEIEVIKAAMGFSYFKMSDVE